MSGPRKKPSTPDGKVFERPRSERDRFTALTSELANPVLKDPQFAWETDPSWTLVGDRLPAGLAACGRMPVAVLDPHPPLDFDLVGMADWRGSKWVSFFQGESGRPVWSVLLDHAIDRVVVTVETAPRAYRDRVMVGEFAEREATDDRGAFDFAAGTLIRLADVARPLLGEDQRRLYNQRISAFAENEARRWTNWESATWQLGARSLGALVFRFAHAWTGLSVDDPNRYIGVTAFNLASSNVRLAEVSGDQYNWDFSQPFSIDGLNAQAGMHPDVLAVLRSTEIQQDHHRVLDGEGRPESF